MFGFFPDELERDYIGFRIAWTHVQVTGAMVGASVLACRVVIEVESLCLSRAKCLVRCLTAKGSRGGGGGGGVIMGECGAV